MSNSKYDLCIKYTGVSPKGHSTEAQPSFKTGVNSRMPLTERVARLHSAVDDNKLVADAAHQSQLKEKLAAIEATPQVIALQRRHADGGSIQQTSIVSTVKSIKDIPPRAHMWTAPGDGKLQNIPLSQCKSMQQTSTDSYVRNKDSEFLSRVRKLEKMDDDERAAQVQANARADEKTNLRSAAVTHKRETDVRFAPPAMQFDRIPRAVPNAVRANASDSVKFTHAPFPSHSELEFADPGVRLNELKKDHDARPEMGVLKNELALGSVSGCVDLQAGTAKDMDHICSSGYSGHVPAHPRNIARINGPGKEVLRNWSKSPIGLVGAAHKNKSIYALTVQSSEARAEEALKEIQDKISHAPKINSASYRHTMTLRGF